MGILQTHLGRYLALSHIFADGTYGDALLHVRAYFYSCCCPVTVACPRKAVLIVINPPQMPILESKVMATKGCSSKYYGVSFDKVSGNWLAQMIIVDKRFQIIGSRRRSYC